MGKYTVPSVVRTLVDGLRELLDEAEQSVGNLAKTGPQVLGLLHLIDRTVDTLVELETNGVDVRAERVRMETIQRQLGRQQRRFVVEAGVAYGETRAAVQPDATRWWWFLDEAVAQQRRDRIRRTSRWGLALAVVCVVMWLVYDRFIAPPPEVREAYQLSVSGENLVETGDLRAALDAFKAATALTPDDPKMWTWQGVLHTKLGEEEEAQAAFDEAYSLYGTEASFLLDRSIAYVRLGDLDAASDDVEQVIADDPQLGWAYYVRSGLNVERGDCFAASADLEQAAELANEAGETQLEALARTQRAMVLQTCFGVQPTELPE